MMIPEHLKKYEWYGPHLKWLGYVVDFEVCRANLYGANLSGADLRRADLSGADLSGADLSGANLSGANLSGADLRRADLRRADLSGADLSGADLSGADLRRANLSGANLSGADLRRASYNPLSIIQASWRIVSDNLCAAMMAFDRDAHCDPESFLRWSKGGQCPYNDVSFTRALPFQENKELYNHSLGSPRVWDLWQMIASEFDIQI